MKKKIIFPICLTLLLSGCAAPQSAGNTETADNRPVQIGTALEIDVPEPFILIENKEMLAAQGLYYASWRAGEASPYKNSDGNTLDIYEAQLYFLTEEASSPEKAEQSRDSWLLAARENYEIKDEKSITVNGENYTLLTYSCSGGDTPHDHGASAFGFHNSIALCAEITCEESYIENPEEILTEFLENCHFKAD